MSKFVKRSFVFVLMAWLLIMPPEVSAAWKYKMTKDHLFNRNNYSASVISRSGFSTMSDWQSSARITLKQVEAEDTVVTLAITGGKLSCRQCVLIIQFDNAAAEVAWVYPDEYGAGDTLFFRGTRYDCLNLSQSDALLNLISKLKRARHIRITVAVADEGDRVFEFETAGLKWPLDSGEPQRILVGHSKNGQICKID